jgi:hypothetical protein
MGTTRTASRFPTERDSGFTIQVVLHALRTTVRSTIRTYTLLRFSMHMEENTLSEFDITSIRNKSFIVCSGARASGKSVLAADILYSKRKAFSSGIIMSNNDDYQKLFPDAFVYKNFDEGVLQTLIERRRRITNENVSEEEFFVLVDDCFCSESVMKSKALNMLVLNGRFLGISVILTVHSCVDIPLRIRPNIDYLFTFAIHNAAHKKWLYERHFPAFKSLAAFRDTLHANTENYKALVLNNTVKSGEIKDTVSWYKANVHEHDGHLVESSESMAALADSDREN